MIGTKAITAIATPYRRRRALPRMKKSSTKNGVSRPSVEPQPFEYAIGAAGRPTSFGDERLDLREIPTPEVADVAVREQRLRRHPLDRARHREVRQDDRQVAEHDEHDPEDREQPNDARGSRRRSSVSFTSQSKHTSVDAKTSNRNVASGSFPGESCSMVTGIHATSSSNGIAERGNDDRLAPQQQLRTEHQGGQDPDEPVDADQEREWHARADRRDRPLAPEPRPWRMRFPTRFAERSPRHPGLRRLRCPRGDRGHAGGSPVPTPARRRRRRCVRCRAARARRRGRTGTSTGCRSPCRAG